ncbi:MAG: ArnT family glycosyltransferase [Solirubrobacteraceae bacterium]
MRFGRALGLIAAVGLALRLVYALALVKSKPLLGDALEFHLQANLLADGKGYVQPFVYQATGQLHASADKPPLYPSLEALVSLLGGRSAAWHHLVGVAAGTATVVVVGLIGRRVAGPRAGLIAVGIAAVYPLMIAADGSLRSESVYALALSLALLAALRFRAAPGVGRGAVLGVAIAAAALTRGEALLLLVLLVVPLAWHRPRAGLVAAAACALVLAPWLVRCWVAFDQPVLISTNVGGLLAGANCPTTYAGSLLGQWDYRCLPKRLPVNEAVAATRLRDQGLRYARDHAGRLPVVIAARVGRSFELYRPHQQATQEAFFEGRDLTVEEVGVALYYVLALLAIAGAVILRRRGGPWWVLAAPVGLVVFVTVISYGFTRFRVGAEPAIVLLAAVAIDAAAARRWGPA